MLNIKSFKLTSGEEVIAEVVESQSFLAGNNSDSLIKIRRPHTLQFQQIPGGQIALALIPWTLSNPTAENIEIPASCILCQFNPSSNVEKQYLEQTSGLTLA